MKFRDTCRLLAMTFVICLIVAAFTLPVFCVLLLSFAFCGGLVVGYFHLGHDTHIYFLWLALLLSTAVMIILVRWNSRHHFTDRITNPVIAFFRKRDDHAA